jgi:AcrR family transcriptional regulator
MPKVSAEHKDAVRRRILDAALVCLRRNGFQDITTRELLAEAGLSTGTFYNYFPTKEQLYEALAEEALADDIERVIDEGAGEGAPLGLALVRFVAEFMMGEPEGAVAVASFRSRTTATPQGAEAVARLNAYVVREFVPLVQKAQAEGFVDPALDAEALVELMDIVWDGLGRRAGADSFQTSYERVGAALLHVLLRGAMADGAELGPLDPITARRERAPEDRTT